MIKFIIGSGKYLTVGGGMPSTHFPSYSGGQGVGNMRYNTNTQNTEVYDGTNWTVLNMGHTTIGLNDEAESLLDWARKKRDEEMDRDLLAVANPTIKDLLEQIKEKEDQIQMVMNLIKKEVTVGS